MLAAWYRQQLRAAAEPLVERWQDDLAVKAKRIFIQAMKSRWGSCNPTTGNLRFNTQLALKPKGCLNYVVLHELTHLKHRHHDQECIAVLDHFMPDWRVWRERLNALPLVSC